MLTTNLPLCWSGLSVPKPSSEGAGYSVRLAVVSHRPEQHKRHHWRLSVLRYLRQAPDVLYLGVLVRPVETRSPPTDDDRYAHCRDRHLVEVGRIELPSKPPFTFKFHEAFASHTTILVALR
jgi:hypothetical protein